MSAEKNDKEKALQDLKYFFYGLGIILAFLCLIAAITFGWLEAYANDDDPCATHGTWVLMAPGKETQFVEMYPAEGGYKVIIGDGVLAIWTEGEDIASIRYDDTYHGVVGFAYPDIEGVCGAITLQVVERIFIDEPWWILTEEA